MRVVKHLCHSDTVSGTTIFDDGSRIYWTEGRGSAVVMVDPNGRVSEIEEGNPHFDAMMTSQTEGDEPWIEMTDDDEREHDEARDKPLSE